MHGLLTITRSRSPISGNVGKLQVRLLVEEICGVTIDRTALAARAPGMCTTRRKTAIRRTINRDTPLVGNTCLAENALDRNTAITPKAPTATKARFLLTGTTVAAGIRARTIEKNQNRAARSAR